MTSSDISQLRAKFEAAGQGHVFHFWDQLNETDRQMLLSQLQLIDIDHITAIVNEQILVEKKQREPSPSEATIKGLPDKATQSVLDANEEERKEWWNHGMEMIRNNKVGVVLLAGGQGTRLGSSDPKGCYNVGLPSEKSLFQLQAERILRLQELASVKGADKQVKIPWYIMTSGPTRERTEKYFKQNGYFGMDSEDVMFFEQGVLPCLTPEGKIILKTPCTVAFAPDGNGGIYNALNRSGVLADFKKRGIEHVHTYCVDNALVKVADPVFIGFSAKRGIDIATKVVRKRDATESVGLIVSKNDRPGVIEYSEISSELATAKEESSGLLKLRAANIVNHYYSAKYLLNIPNWTTSYLPFHKASKKIPYVDLETGQVVEKPTKANGIKLEQFVFDVFPQVDFDNFASLEVSRQEEFSPLKNGPGATNDCPETARRDLLALGTKWLQDVGAKLEPETHQVEVSPLTSYGGEALDQYQTQTITQDVL